VYQAGQVRKRTVDQLSISDEGALRRVAVYAALKEALRRDRYVFRILPPSSSRWNHALLLNLTYWNGQDGDVLASDRVPADVVAHAAWHHVAARAIGASGPGAPRVPGADALFFGESIASAFDAYLVGRLLDLAPRCSFLATQVPALADAARAAGLSAKDFAGLLERMASDPEASFESLRQLLYDTARALVVAEGAEEAHRVLVRARAHRFGPLLHHYELSNWVLYARAYAGPGASPRPENGSSARELRRVQSRRRAGRGHPVQARTRVLDAELRHARRPFEALRTALLGSNAADETGPTSGPRRRVKPAV
jgi:hypothetical protein